MGHKDCILIVDDERINLDFFDVMLTKLGFIVERAEDGEAALVALAQRLPDLIILDNVMPKMSGWDLTRLLKHDPRYERYKHIPIVMFSAMDDIQDKIAGYELGVEDYLTKPFNFSEVLARLKAVLRNKDLAAQLRRRENRIAIIESLNRSLEYFAGHVKKPVADIYEQANDLDLDNKQQVSEFVRQVKDESATILATIEGLKDEVQDLKNQAWELQEAEVSLEGLEEKYQKHFRSYYEKNHQSKELRE
jgi:DNA-binding response OmpR family regulator